MKLDLEKSSGNLIRSCTGGEIRIGGSAFSAPLIVTADRIIPDWSPPAVHELTLADFRRVLELEPELILLGTGGQQHFPPPALTTSILTLGVGLEVMSTVAACRTFNVLAAEYRRVAAALFID